MTDINNAVPEQRHSDPSELKHTDLENNEQSQSSYETVAPKAAVVENSTHNSVENAVTEESTNGYTRNENEEKDPPSPPSEKEPTSTNKPTEKTKSISEKVSTTTKTRKVAENTFAGVIPKVNYLVFWENPVHSGSVLAGALSFIIFTTYFSLLNASCYVTVYALLLNLLHVLLRERLQKFLKNEAVNPFEKFLTERPVYIDRTTADKYIDICIDSINYLLLEGQQIALIDDPMRSFKYIVILYVSWSILSWMSFQTFIITTLILGFTLPKAYLSNKALVDEQLEHLLKIINAYWERFVSLAKHHTKGYSDKVLPFIVSTGLISNEKPADQIKKEE